MIAGNCSTWEGERPREPPFLPLLVRYESLRPNQFNRLLIKAIEEVIILVWYVLAAELFRLALARMTLTKRTKVCYNSDCLQYRSSSLSYGNFCHFCWRALGVLWHLIPPK